MLEIGRSIADFAREKKIEKGAVTFNLTVAVTYGELRDKELLEKIESQDWFKKSGAGRNLDTEIAAKIASGEVHPQLRRVTSVVYVWTSVSPEGLKGTTRIGEDLWLLAETK